MQRDQQEQMLRQETSGLENSFNTLDHSFSSQPTSRFTLDSEKARFAASAVINSAQLNVQTTSVATTPAGTVTSTTTTTVANGPVADSKYPENLKLKGIQGMW